MCCVIHSLLYSPNNDNCDCARDVSSDTQFRGRLGVATFCIAGITLSDMPADTAGVPDSNPARTDSARDTTDAGIPAMRATCIPYERFATPAIILCINTISLLCSRTSMVKHRTLCSLPGGRPCQCGQFVIVRCKQCSW